MVFRARQDRANGVFDVVADAVLHLPPGPLTFCQTTNMLMAVTRAIADNPPPAGERIAVLDIVRTGETVDGEELIHVNVTTAWAGSR
ncbi:hypothetical protein SAMN04488561_3323 [Jiangella alba]|uniref:Uncharacterized protein n=2 Tax=Jiangella alba TaxID=561176 RepID=A0A1H5MSD8_9ACTN|nr:hypothetical protein SAMN04488561_3323 [Jiangella alba]